MNKFKIGYFADGPWAHKAFKKIIYDTSIEIAFICVRFDHRDEILVDYAKEYNIDLLYEKNINCAEFINKMREYNVDLFVSMSFNQIFKSELINLPK